MKPLLFPLSRLKCLCVDWEFAVVDGVVVVGGREFQKDPLLPLRFSC